MHTRLFPHYIWDLGKGMLNIIRKVVNVYLCQVGNGCLFWFFFISILLTPELTCEARFAYTVIAIDAIFANTIVTWVTGTIINIYLTVGACGKKVYHVKIRTIFICKILFHMKI